MAAIDRDPPDEFWIEPMHVEDGVARLHASFNDYAVAIAIGRKDAKPMSKQEAAAVLSAIVARLPEEIQH